MDNTGKIAERRKAILLGGLFGIEFMLSIISFALCLTSKYSSNIQTAMAGIYFGCALMLIPEKMHVAIREEYTSLRNIHGVQIIAWLALIICPSLFLGAELMIFYVFADTYVKIYIANMS